MAELSPNDPRVSKSKDPKSKHPLELLQIQLKDDKYGAVKSFEEIESKELKVINFARIPSLTDFTLFDVLDDSSFYILLGAALFSYLMFRYTIGKTGVDPRLSIRARVLFGFISCVSFLVYNRIMWNAQSNPIEHGPLGPGYFTEPFIDGVRFWRIADFWLLVLSFGVGSMLWY